MRLLEFHPKAYRNLRDLPVIFTLDPDERPGDACSIRFLVGVNGTGKTNLLRFLASVFAALDESYRRPRPRNPAYNVPFRLKYQTHGNTITLSSTGQGRQGLTFNVNGQSYESGDLPGRDLILPHTLMVYTSGDVGAWRGLFEPHQPVAAEEELPESLPLELLPDEERPPIGVSRRLTIEIPSEQLLAPWELLHIFPHGQMTDLSGSSTGLERVFLVEPEHLPLALLAAWLRYHVDAEVRSASGADFIAFLKEVGLHRLLGFSLQMVIDSEQLAQLPPEGRQRRLLERLHDLATLPLIQWKKESREEQLWVYDLDDVHVASGQSLLARLAETPLNDAFQFFRDMVDLYERGILLGGNLIVQYPPQADGQLGRTLLAEYLSDGELAFLQRMALIHLLSEDECLFLLDEPDTHFNDDWKRNLVDHIEQTLRETGSEVILTTHASITLTDAYPEEVILLTEYGQDRVPLTLAAEPGELLRSVFGADRSVGKRAMRDIEWLIEQGTDQELEALLDQVGPGYFRFKIVEELRRRVPSDQQS